MATTPINCQGIKDKNGNVLSNGFTPATHKHSFAEVTSDGTATGTTLTAALAGKIRSFEEHVDYEEKLSLNVLTDTISIVLLRIDEDGYTLDDFLDAGTGYTKKYVNNAGTTSLDMGDYAYLFIHKSSNFYGITLLGKISQ